MTPTTLREQLLRDELIWAAAFLEGEGSFYAKRDCGTVVISANQVERWPLDKIQAALGGRIRLRKTSPGWQDQEHWEVTGPRAVAIAFTLYRWLSPKRRAQIHAAIKAWRSHRAQVGHRPSCVNDHPYVAGSFSMEKIGAKSYRRCRACQAAAQRRWRERQSCRAS